MDEHFLFYVPPDQIAGDQVRFPDEEARHITKVLRKRTGDAIQVTDGAGHRMTVRLLHTGKHEVTGEIVAREQTPPEPECILAMGVIRQRDRLEFAVEKAVELGATRLILVHSDHTGKTSVKPGRIDKIIISAMKQSRRTRLPEWEERQSFAEVIAHWRGRCRIIMAHPDGADRIAKQLTPRLVLVGPEGGFSDAEVEQVIEAGGELLSLGPARLRAETAVCAALSLAR